MRNKIISTFRTVVLAAVLAACGSDDKIDGIDTPANSVVIRAGIDNGLARSGSLTVPDGYKPRHVIEVWSTGNNPRPIHREEQVTTGSEPVVFNFKLTDGGNYKALLWTDFVEKNAIVNSREYLHAPTLTTITYTHHDDCHYMTGNNLKNIAISHAGTDYTVNDESRDAFFACVDIVKGAEAYNQDVTLKRPFGQLNIIEKNPGAPAGVASMTLAYSVPGTFDVETGTPGPATLAVNPTVTTLPVPTATRKANLFYDYIFAPAPDAQTTLGQIAMTFTGNGFDYDDFTVPALVPVARNRRTNISGSILYSNNASVTVTVSDSWDNTSVDMDLVFIPDPVFRNFCINNDYANADGYLFTDKAAAVTGTLDVERQLGINLITSLAGIEYFTNITGLNCSGNALKTLDVSKNTKLQTLDCHNNPSLDQLDVTRNTELTGLLCNNNRLTALDVSKNTKLKTLDCSNNRIDQLDVTRNTALVELLCYNNRIRTLDASGMTKDPANNTWNLSCGLQANDRYTNILLGLTLREDQKSYWESRLKGEAENQYVYVN